MSYLEELYNNKKRYENLKKDINEVVDKISGVINNLHYPIINLENSLMIDGYSAGANKLKNIKSNLEIRNSYLSGNVVTSINNSIFSTNSEITREDQRIKEEQRIIEEQKQLEKINQASAKSQPLQTKKQTAVNKSTTKLKKTSF